MNSVNLIPATRRETAARRARVRAWTIAVGAASALSVGGATTVRMMWAQDSGPIRSEIGAAQATVAASEAALVKIRGEVARLRQAELAARMVGEHPDWSVLLRAINQSRGDGVALETFELRQEAATPVPAAATVDTKPVAAAKPTERYRLTMKGIGTDLPRVMTFVERLERLGIMESVTLKQSRAEAALGVTVTGFDIECALAERPSAAGKPPAAGATADASAKGDRP